jgi:hypothetical protein
MSEQELNLDTYARAIWRAKWIIIAAALAASAIAAFTVYSRPIQHRAVALIQIGRVWKEPLEDYFVAEKVASSPVFLRNAATGAGLNPRDVRRSVAVEVIQGGPRRARYAVLLQVAATSENQDDALRFADVVVKAIIARHDAMFEEALAPHRDQQHRLEERQKELAGQPSSGDLLIRVEHELDDVRAKNTVSDGSITDKTRLIQEPSSDAVPRASLLRPTVAAGSLTALAVALIAAIAGHFRELNRPKDPEGHPANDAASN